MTTYAIFVLNVAVSVFGHECKDYSLSASDQSLIDMMKHYLHTSRKIECSDTQTGSSGTAVTYVRWGQKSCPDSSELVYHGQAGGNSHAKQGGGINYLCLPSDPENGQTFSFDNDGLYGAEYQLASPRNPSWLSGSLHDKEVPCAVCRREGKSTVIMIPGRKTCYSGWKGEYKGILMSSGTGHNSMEYVCMDKEAVPLDEKNGDENGALFYAVRARCGSLRCPPYKDQTEVYCVVCSK